MRTERIGLSRYSHRTVVVVLSVAAGVFEKHHMAVGTNFNVTVGRGVSP
jgi:hypothetical protein